MRSIQHLISIRTIGTIFGRQGIQLISVVERVRSLCVNSVSVLRNVVVDVLSVCSRDAYWQVPGIKWVMKPTAALARCAQTAQHPRGHQMCHRSAAPQRSA